MDETYVWSFVVWHEYARIGELVDASLKHNCTYNGKLYCWFLPSSHIIMLLDLR